MDVGEWRVDTVRTTLGLLQNPVRIWQAVEHRLVGGNAIPTLTAGGVLHQVHPSLVIWNVLMLMPVPLGNRDAGDVSKSSKNLEFVVVVVEDDDSVMFLCQLLTLLES